ncbi:D-TA family PLP-dependent enzyme [Sinobaca sp. H24]|uniref:D-TA family PLP-dependent enzyme n=1 Tax=Sinobaca sp. H24 TaxID=2923376 RepID=UPI00207AA827|nr:D-TA family PLP-dependent enzyme [Sinobaca sp. H24]
MYIRDIDTPALLIDKNIMMRNLQSMQAYADKNNVTLRPHTKTHKMPAVACLQEEAGAVGIAAAKVGEAEVMAERGLKNIFIANEIVGVTKLNRIRTLAETIHISFGIDNTYQVTEIEKVFEGAAKKAQVLIEIEVGEKRSGITTKPQFIELLRALKKCSNVEFKGLFSHDGHSYKAETKEECRKIYMDSVKSTLDYAAWAEEMNMKAETVSIGSTPPFMFDFEVPAGVTEIRPGTYIFMDVSQGNVIGSYDRCAASVLTTVISKPTEERVITDVGAKGLTAQSRNAGLTKTEGYGTLKAFDGIHVDGVFDEHAIINNASFRANINIGEKIEIIPNHICPVCNLYEKAYVISNNKVEEELLVEGRGKLQ